MRVEQLGSGDPEIVIVGSIHGDEPCGARAIDRLIESDPPVERPVKLIVANEKALAREVRYVDADLNRAFDGTARGHEDRLADALAAELAGCTVLSIHSTQSHTEPFGLVADPHGPIARVCSRLPLTAVVVIEEPRGRPFVIPSVDLLEVEAGPQGTVQAVENAHELAVAFLIATGSLPGDVHVRELPLFRLEDPIRKPPADSYEVCVENFTRVESGATIATVDGEPIRAARSFYPILVSAGGYRDQFGYRGSRLGTLEA